MCAKASLPASREIERTDERAARRAAANLIDTTQLDCSVVVVGALTMSDRAFIRSPKSESCFAACLAD